MNDVVRRALLTKLLFVTAALVLYGSLFPFEFAWPSNAPLNQLFSFSFVDGRSLGDTVGNIVIFVPIGFLGAVLFDGSVSYFKRLAGLFLGGLLLAGVAQFLQLFVPSRDPAFADIVWNMVGLTLGIAGVRMLSANKFLAYFPSGLPSFPVALVVLWVLAEFIPLIPSIDFQQFKDSLKHFFFGGGVSIGRVLLSGASVLLLAESLVQVLGMRRTQLWLIPILIVGVFLKVIVVAVLLDASITLGWVVGALAWLIMVRSRVKDRLSLSALFLLAALIIGALEPFRFSSEAGRLHLLPFSSFLEGAMLANTRELLTKLFLFSGLLWLAQGRVKGLTSITVGLACIVFTLELSQTYVEGRTASVDDALLVLLAGLMVAQWNRLIGKTDGVDQATVAFSAHDAVRAERSPGVAMPSQTIGLRAIYLAGTLLAALLIGVSILLILRLPGLPYNVRELFLEDGLFHTTLFGLALLWIGIGGYWAGHFAARISLPVLFLPLTGLLAGTVSLALLSSSVTKESISDIAGSTNLYWFVMNKGIWGEWAQGVFPFFGSMIVSFFERIVRYAALYGPLVGMLGFIVALRLRFSGRSRTDVGGHWALSATMGLLVWLVFCKVIAFDWSSTDNLNELVAPPGTFGLGGGGYLYLLVLLLAVNATLLAVLGRGFGGLVFSLAFTVLAIPLGWLLLQQGLHPAVEKYGMIFSGVQFLLGPDRRSILADDELFLRWAFVYLAGLAAIAVGLWLGKGLLGGEGRGHRASRVGRSA